MRIISLLFVTDLWDLRSNPYWPEPGSQSILWVADVKIIMPDI